METSFAPITLREADAPILILDEATSALATESQRAVQYARLHQMGMQAGEMV